MLREGLEANASEANASEANASNLKYDDFGQTGTVDRPSSDSLWGASPGAEKANLSENGILIHLLVRILVSHSIELQAAVTGSPCCAIGLSTRELKSAADSLCVSYKSRV